MYLINYNTGAVQYSTAKDLSEWVNGLSTGTIVTIIDVEAKKALIKSADNEIGWVDIPEKKVYSDEELEKLG